MANYNQKMEKQRSIERFEARYLGSKNKQATPKAGMSPTNLKISDLQHLNTALDPSR